MHMRICIYAYMHIYAYTYAGQISPFPFDHVHAEVEKYPNAEVVWCQEETKNGGSWFYTRPRITTAARGVRDVRPTYVGRGPAAATSTGSAAQVTLIPTLTLTLP